MTRACGVQGFVDGEQTVVIAKKEKKGDEKKQMGLLD